VSDSLELTPAGPRSNRPVRFIVTVIIFTLLGRLVGVGLTVVGYIAFGFPYKGGSNGAYAAMALLAYGIWKAHPLGFVTAAGIGCIIAVRDLFGGTRLLEAAAIGGAIGVIWAWLLAPGKMHDLFTQLVVGSFLIATLVGWALTRWTRRWA
jgi:hypothetical protein